MMFNKLKNYTLDQYLRFGIYLYLFLLPWQTHWLAQSLDINKTFWESGSIRIYATQIILWILILTFLISRWKTIGGFVVQRRVTPKDVLKHWWVLLAMWMLSMFLSIFRSVNFSVSLNIWWQFLGGLGLLLLLEKVGIDRIKVAWSFVIGVLFSTLLGIYQFVFQSTFAAKWLGLAAIKSRELGASVVEYGDTRWLRAYGSLNHPNILGAFIVIAIILSLWLWMNARTAKNTGLACGSFIILFVGLFLSFSRQAWLVFVVAMIVLGLFVFIKKSWREDYGLVFLKAIVLLVLIGASLVISYRQIIQTRFTPTERLEKFSIDQRVQSMKDGWQIFKGHPLNGVGLGGFSQVLFDDMSKDNKPVYGVPQPAHNSYLLALAEVGASTAILYFLVLLQTALIVWQRYKLQKDLWSVVIAVLFLTIFVLSGFDHYTWSIYPGIMLWWVVVGLVYGNAQKIKNSK